MVDQTLRGFIANIEANLPNEFLRINAPVKRDLDITSTVFELERNGKSPLLFFENVEGFDLPVVTNVAGNRDLLSVALNTPADRLPITYRERCQGYLPAETVNDAPWQEVILEAYT